MEFIDLLLLVLMTVITVLITIITMLSFKLTRQSKELMEARYCDKLQDDSTHEVVAMEKKEQPIGHYRQENGQWEHIL